MGWCVHKCAKHIDATTMVPEIVSARIDPQSTNPETVLGFGRVFTTTLCVFTTFELSENKILKRFQHSLIPEYVLQKRFLQVIQGINADAQ